MSNQWLNLACSEYSITILGGYLAVFHNPRATMVDRMVGRKIKERRLEQGLSKLEVARHIGCSTAAYDALEDGYLRPDVSTLQALAGLLKCRMGDFFADIK